MFINIHVFSSTEQSQLEQHIVNTLEHVFSESCGNTPTHVGGEKGQIWITWAQYRNNMNCQWQISVDSTKVNYNLHL